MEALTRLVTDSLARHGLDRPVDPSRLKWSSWFRCDSPQSLLIVPSKPGIFALAEEIPELGPDRVDAGDSPAPSSAANLLGEETLGGGISGERALGKRVLGDGISGGEISGDGTLGGARLQRCDSQPLRNAALAADGKRRMLAVLQFSEDDDMAFTLDRMFIRANPLRSRLASGRCFLRFVVLADQAQRRSICAALNQWMRSSAEKASGTPAGFQSSLERTDCTGTTRVGAGQAPGFDRKTDCINPAPHLDSGSAKNLHCPQPLPSGF